MGGRRGLTLIETLVVLAVLAAIMGLALPVLDGWRVSAQMDEAVARVESGVAAGRAAARESGKPVPVQVGTRTAGAVLVEVPSGVVVHAPVKRNAETRPEKASDAPLVLALCMPDGTVEPGESVIEAGGRSVEVAISRWTGAVSTRAPAKKSEDGGDADEAPCSGEAP